jgi:hypothetical protein
MEDLNKQQIILLCILISFVVSIATGIMTTSLLMQAPVELTKTVNQIVERTVETVTPAPTPSNPNPVSKQVETVVVNEDDSVTSAIAKNTPSVVRIHEQSADGTIDNLYGLGIVVSQDGIIATDKKSVSSVMNYVAIMSDNTQVQLIPIVTDKKAVVGFFKAKISTTTPYTFTPVSLLTSDLKLGQTLIAIGGDSTNAVSVGRVMTLNMKTTTPSSDGTDANGQATSTSTPVTYVSSIVGDVAPQDDVSGAPIISLSGDVVGLSLSSYSSSKIYIPSAIIKQEIDSIVVAQ